MTLLGVIDVINMILFLLICVLLCGLLWLFYAWCDLGRILAGLYEMKCLQEEWNSEHDQCDGKTTEPASERDKRVRLHVKLRRKAFLFCPNADKLDHVPLKPLRGLIGYIGKVRYQLSEVADKPVIRVVRHGINLILDIGKAPICLCSRLCRIAHTASE